MSNRPSLTHRGEADQDKLTKMCSQPRVSSRQNGSSYSQGSIAMAVYLHEGFGILAFGGLTSNLRRLSSEQEARSQQVQSMTSLP